MYDLVRDDAFTSIEAKSRGYGQWTEAISLCNSPLVLLAASAMVCRLSRKEERAETVERRLACRAPLLVTNTSTSGRLPCTGLDEWASCINYLVLR